MIDRMTVREYAAKYGIPPKTVYRMIERGNLRAVREDGRINVSDVPPPPPARSAVTIDRFDGYALTLLWLSATIMADSDVCVRTKDSFVPEYLSAVLGGHHIIRNRRSSAYNLKISSMTLVGQLRALGFTGRKDASLPPPPVSDPLAFLAAFVECRTSLVYALSYPNRDRRDKADAVYRPAVSLCASRPIMERVVRGLCTHGMIPPRVLSPAANGTSATVRISSQRQLRAIYDCLSPLGENDKFWGDLYAHITNPPVPYYEYRERKERSN